MKRTFFITFLLQGIFVSLLAFAFVEKSNSDFASAEVEKAIDWEEVFSESDDESKEYEFGGSDGFTPSLNIEQLHSVRFSEPLNYVRGSSSKRHIPLFILHCSLKVDC